MAEPSQKYLLVSDSNISRVIRIIQWLIDSRRAKWLKEFISQIHPGVMANLWDHFSEQQQNILINTLDIEDSAGVISELYPEERIELFKSKKTEWIIDRLEELDSDDVVDILKGLPTKEANFIIRKFGTAYSEKVKSLMSYKEETAGALMTSEFLAVNAHATVEKIISLFRAYVETDELEDLHFIYVTNRKNQLLGYIPIRKLIVEKPHKKASEIMSEPTVVVDPGMDQEHVARIFRDYDLISVPVVDEHGVLLGRITIDDIVDVLDDEASEDVFKMVGLNKNEKSSDTIKTSIKRRLPWMFINVLTASLSAIVISFFEPTLQKFVVLATFMPMIAALGGATGNQMVAMIVRGLAIGEFHWKQVRWILLRELTTVALGSLLIGGLVSTIAYFHKGKLELGIIVFISLLLNMLFATGAGIGFPLLLKWMKFDPALGSSIMVSASTDLMGFFIFLGLASVFLH